MTDTALPPLDEQDIVELAEFFDLLAKFDAEDKQREQSKI
jgi:hypothetical protein